MRFTFSCGLLAVAIGFYSAPVPAVETSSQTLATPSRSTPAAVAKPQNASPVALRFRPRVGQTRVVRLYMVQKAAQILNSKNSSMRQLIVLDIEYHVASISKDGLVRLRTKVVGTRYLREIDGKETESYDSRRPPKVVSDNAETFALIHGFQFVMQMKPNGSIAAVENQEQIADQMLDKMKVSQESRQYVRPAVIAMLEGNAFKNFGNTFASFPDAPVTIGSSWPKRDIVGSDYHLIYDGQLKLAKRDKARSTLHLKSVIKPDPNRPAGAVALPIQGRQSGYFLVENQTGWTQRARLEQRWNARLSADGQFVPPTSPLARHNIEMQLNFDIGVIQSKP